MPKILLTTPVPEPISAQFLKLLGERADFQAVTTPGDEEFTRLAADADILINLSRPLDANALAQAPKVRFIQQVGVGYNNLDTAALLEAGILASKPPVGK